MFAAMSIIVSYCHWCYFIVAVVSFVIGAVPVIVDVVVVAEVEVGVQVVVAIGVIPGVAVNAPCCPVVCGLNV